MVKTIVTAPGVVHAFIGCMGGRHRSVFIARKLADELGVGCNHIDL
jgi:RNase adaptor protein for sRNA GlmZ degradation